MTRSPETHCNYICSRPLSDFLHALTSKVSSRYCTSTHPPDPRFFFIVDMCAVPMRSNASSCKSQEYDIKLIPSRSLKLFIEYHKRTRGAYLFSASAAICRVSVSLAALLPSLVNMRYKPARHQHYQQIKSDDEQRWHRSLPSSRLSSLLGFPLC